jgi:cytochrome c-type biogenesis protein CcmH/NrfG
MLGDIARAQGDNKTAVEAYRTALALKPERTDLQSVIDSLSPSASSEVSVTP